VEGDFGGALVTFYPTAPSTVIPTAGRDLSTSNVASQPSIGKMTSYYVYFLTNQNREVLYVGFTNNLVVRLTQHREEAYKQYSRTFCGRYQCFHLIYYELYNDPNTGIAREKELKKWRREKKLALINSTNPDWRFLNNEVLGHPE
jgi:putative endonuclease